MCGPKLILFLYYQHRNKRIVKTSGYNRSTVGKISAENHLHTFDVVYTSVPLTKVIRLKRYHPNVLAVYLFIGGTKLLKFQFISS